MPYQEDDEAIRRRLAQFSGRPGVAPVDIQDPRMVTRPPMMAPQERDPINMEPPRGPAMEAMPSEEGMSPGFSPDSMPTQARAMMMHGPASFRKEYGRDLPPAVPGRTDDFSAMRGLQDNSPLNDAHVAQHQVGNKFLRGSRQEALRQLSAIHQRLLMNLRNSKSAADTKNIQSTIDSIQADISRYSRMADESAPPAEMAQ